MCHRVTVVGTDTMRSRFRVHSVAKHAAVDYMHSLQLMRRKDPDWEPKVRSSGALSRDT